MLLENHQQLCHTFFDFYIYQGNILSKKNLQKQQYHTFLVFYIDQESNTKKKSINYFFTHFLSNKAFRNNCYCRRVSIDRFITYCFKSYSIEKQLLTRMRVIFNIS